MNTRQVATTGITLALGFILGALAWQPSVAQRKPDEAAKAEQKAVGRYQPFLEVAGANTRIWAMETDTGKLWELDGNTLKWAERSDPIPAPKK